MYYRTIKSLLELSNYYHIEGNGTTWVPKSNIYKAFSFPDKFQLSQNYNLRKDINNLIEEDVLFVCDFAKVGVSKARYALKDEAKLKQFIESETSKPKFIKKKPDGVKLCHKVNELNKAAETEFMYDFFDKGRITNPLCGMKTKERSHKKVPDYYREDYLDSVWGSWEHWDVPSSIPQIIYAMNNNGNWYGKRVWDELGDNVKNFSYSIIFNRNDYFIAKSILEIFMEKYGCASVEVLDTNGRYHKRYIYSLTKNDELVSKAHSLVQKLERIVGPFQNRFGCKNTELFIHESNIYTLARYKALKQYGVYVAAVYDSFYWKKTKGFNWEILESLIKESAKEYVQNMAFVLEQDRKEYELQERIDLNQRRPSVKNKPSATWKKTVRVWAKRNPTSTNYPKNWDEKMIEYADKITR